MSESIRAIPINLLIWWTGISRRPRIGVREPWNTAKLQTNWFRAFLFYIYKSAWNPPFWSGAICLPVSKIIQFGNWEYRFVMVCLVFVFWKTCFVIKFSEALPYYRECILSRLQETIPRYRTWNRKPLLSPNLLWWNLSGPSSHSGTVEGVKVSQFESDVFFPYCAHAEDRPKKNQEHRWKYLVFSFFKSALSLIRADER